MESCIYNAVTQMHVDIRLILIARPMAVAANYQLAWQEFHCEVRLPSEVQAK